MRASWCSVVVVLGLVACKSESKQPAAPPAAGTAGSAATAPAPTAPAPTAPAPTDTAAPTAPPAADKLLGSCAIASIACSDYYGSADVAPLKSACAGAGTWSDGPCPAGSVGTCTKSEGGGITNKAHTYPPGTPASAQKACANTPGGVYSDG